jgi:hypothetical protein
MAHASNPNPHSEPVMSVLRYPSTKDYRLPRKNILVIGCIDLRLTDNLVHFLHFDNLHNRYDHFTLAGASLLCTGNRDLFKKDKEDASKKDPEDPFKKYPSLDNAKQVLLDHVQIAKDLHHIEDVYIVEHEDCGAYKEFLDANKVKMSTPDEERHCHQCFAYELAKELCNTYKLHVHCFFIDLRGNVELLDTFKAPQPVSSEPAPSEPTP